MPIFLLLNFYIFISSLLHIYYAEVVFCDYESPTCCVGITYVLNSLLFLQLSTCHCVICRPLTLSSWQVSSTWYAGLRRYTFVTSSINFEFFSLLNGTFLLFSGPGYLTFSTSPSIQACRYVLRRCHFSWSRVIGVLHRYKHTHVRYTLSVSPTAWVQRLDFLPTQHGTYVVRRHMYTYTSVYVHVRNTSTCHCVICRPITLSWQVHHITS